MLKNILSMTLALSFSVMAGPNERQVLNATQAFSKKLIKPYIESKSVSDNLFISGKNVSDALTLLLMGAGDKSQTEKELMELLGFQDTWKTGQAISGLKAINTDLTQKRKKTSAHAKEPTKINLANSVWANEAAGFEFSDTFKKYTRTHLLAEARSVDMGREETLGEINGWVSKKTEKLIPKLLAKLDPSTQFILISTLFIEGLWKFEFQDHNTSEGDFVLVDGSKSKLDLMRQIETLPYQSGKTADEVGYQVVGLPTHDGLAMLEVYLPDDGKETAKFRKGFLGNTLVDSQKLLEAETGVDLTLPRFKLKFKDEAMQAVLSSKEFIPTSFNGADFTSMGNKNIPVSQVIHETVLEVYETGFKAAAATAIIGLESMVFTPRDPKVVKLNRPFGVRIVAKTHDQYVELFKGWVANPEKLAKKD